MVNILFLFSPTICKEKRSFQTVYKYNNVFFNKKRIAYFILLNKSKNVL